MNYIKQPEQVKLLDWNDWSALRSYIEANRAIHVSLYTHIDTLRYYILEIVKEQDATANS